MKNKLCASMTLAWLSTLDPQLSTLLAQGSLTPPGAPVASISNYGLNARTANGCYGSGGNYLALNATIANNCYGSGNSGNGLNAIIAIGCYGFSVSGLGLGADLVNSCVGATDSGTALSYFFKCNMP
jgi:hypothetical protein